MPHRIFITLLLLGVGALSAARDFVLPLKLTHAQLGEIFIGCREGATDAYDRDMDDLAPPPGMNTGYAGLYNSTVKNSLLYKDIKGHGDLKQWEIRLQVHKDKPLKISWQSEKLPACYDLTLVTDDYEKDMSKVNEVVFAASQTITIVAGFNPEAAAAAAKAQGEAGTAKVEKSPPKGAAEPLPEAEEVPISSKRVAGGVSMLVIAMGALLLLIVIFAAVRR